MYQWKNSILKHFVYHIFKQKCQIYLYLTSVATRALQKMEFSELFVFASFEIVQLPKFGNFLEISGLFELVEILQK